MYIEILNDDIIEADRQFVIQLLSFNPQVKTTNGRATVTIVDDDGRPTESTLNPTILRQGKLF